MMRRLMIVWMMILGVVAQAEPVGLLLGWQRDPTTTMTIDWHTLDAQERPPTLRYRPVGDAAWREAGGTTQPFPFVAERLVHRVELTGLLPGREYEFRLGTAEEVRWFRTMPERLDRPLRIAMGGDTNPGGYMRRSNWHAMRYDVDFIVWGGDLAYANGKAANVHRWLHWFESVTRTLTTDDGRVVPVLFCIGNHEVQRVRRTPEDTDDSYRAARAPYFYALMAFPGQPGYNVLDFGDYLSLVALDSNHTNPIEGPQTEWLATVLDARAGRMRHIIPFYHVAGYPSVRSFDGATAAAIRTHWHPLFEEAGVRLAFEHDDHTYKRTVPLRAGTVDVADGITYIGDGAWGVNVRVPFPAEETWYLERSAQEHHAIILTLDQQRYHALVIATDADAQGRILDEYPAGRDDILRLEPKRWTARPDLPFLEPTGRLPAAPEEALLTIPLPTEGWRFRLDPQRSGYTSTWHEPGFDDHAWDSFAIGRHWTREPAYLNYVGPAWYRRTITMPARPANAEAARVQLALYGVDEMAWIWVNGHFVGQQAIGPEGWDRPFALNVTEAIRWGADNQLTIMAENTQDGGGIYQPIILQVVAE